MTAASTLSGKKKCDGIRVVAKDLDPADCQETSLEEALDSQGGDPDMIAAPDAQQLSDSTTGKTRLKWLVNYGTNWTVKSSGAFVVYKKRQK